MWFRRGDWVHGKPRPDRWCVDDANQKQMGGEARRAQSRHVFLRVEDGGASPGSYGSSLHTRDTQAFSEVTPWECGAEATPSHDKTAKVALQKFFTGCLCMALNTVLSVDVFLNLYVFIPLIKLKSLCL